MSDNNKLVNMWEDQEVDISNVPVYKNFIGEEFKHEESNLRNGFARIWNVIRLNDKNEIKDLFSYPTRAMAEQSIKNALSKEYFNSANFIIIASSVMYDGEKENNKLEKF